MTANGVASWKQCCAEGDKGHEEIRLQMSARKPNGEPTIIKPAQSRVSLLNVQSEANDPATGKKVAQSLRIAYEAVSHRLQSLRKLVEETEEEEKTIRKAYRELSEAFSRGSSSPGESPLNVQDIFPDLDTLPARSNAKRES